MTHSDVSVQPSSISTSFVQMMDSNVNAPVPAPVVDDVNIIDLLSLDPFKAFEKLQKVSDIYTRLSLATTYLQYLADARKIILSSSHKYYELYYYPENLKMRYQLSSDDEDDAENVSNTRIFSSCWRHRSRTSEQAKRFKNPQNHMHISLIPTRDVSEDEQLCHYWISFTDGEYAVSTIFHKEDLD